MPSWHNEGQKLGQLYQQSVLQSSFDLALHMSSVNQQKQCMRE